jgi:hypothetical protein
MQLIGQPSVLVALAQPRFQHVAGLRARHEAFHANGSA